MPIDIGFIAFFAYGFWQGYSRGIINTIFNLAIYVFGIVLSFKMSPTTSSILQAMFHSDNPAMFLWAFLVNLLIIILIFRQAAKSLEVAMRMAYLGVLNQIAGGMVMGGFMVLIYSVLIWFATKVHLVNDATIAESKSYEILEPLPIKAKDLAIRLKPHALEVWGTSLNWMDRLDKYGVERTGGEEKTYRPPDDPKAIEEDPDLTPRKPNGGTTPAFEDEEGIEE